MRLWEIDGKKSTGYYHNKTLPYLFRLHNNANNNNTQTFRFFFMHAILFVIRY